MEAPLQAQYGAPLEPPGFGSAHPESDPGPDAERDYLRGSQFAPDGTSSAGSSTPISSLAAEEEESLVDSQPICFKENPFLVANRRGKGRPAGQQVLSGPPVGYGKGGHLQPWLFNKAAPSDFTRTESPIREAPYSPTIQPPSHHSSNSSLHAGRETRFANLHFTSTPTANTDSTSSSTRPGAIQPVGRARQSPSPATPDGHSPNPFQHGPSPFDSQTSPRAPSLTSPDELPMNVKQAYKAFAAVPRSLAVLEPPQDLYGVRNNFHPKQTPESPSPGGKSSPEQRSFRDRQKYFEIDMKQQTPEKPKPRVSLVGEDDLKKMREEEERKFEQRAQEYLLDEEEDDEEEDLAKQVAQMKVTGKVLLDGVEYNVEPISSPSQHRATPPSYSAAPPSYSAAPPDYSAAPPSYNATPPSYNASYCGSSGPPSVDGKGESQRNSLEDGFRVEQRPTSMTGLIPAYPGDSAAPVRTAKAERRHQERLRMQSPELAVAPDRDLSPAEKRALEAEKRAMWRAARPCGLEEDVRQYEQDLAKRLYQARVRASQGTADPQPPTSSSSSSSAAAASQLRMKSLEQDALKAQMVIAKSRDGKKRGTLDQLTESPSPAPTPSPTPMEELSPRGVTSPGRMSLSSKKFDYRQFAAIPSSKPVYDIQTPDAVEELQFIDDGSSNPGDYLG